MPLLLQQPTHARDENGCAVVDWFMETVPSGFSTLWKQPPGDAMDIVTLLANGWATSNSIPNPESVEFGEDTCRDPPPLKFWWGLL